MTVSERIYRTLLKAYPTEYLKRYGQPMAQAFGDQLRAATSISKFVRLWLRTLADWATTVSARHLEKCQAGELLSRSWSDEALRTIFFARYEASWSGHAEITLEDLLLGALRIDRAFAVGVVGEAMIHDIRSELAGSTPGQCIAIPRSHWKRCKTQFRTPLSEPCKRALGRATEEANGSGASRATARHVIGGILQEEGSLAARVFERHGVDLAQIRSRYS